MTAGLDKRVRTRFGTFGMPLAAGAAGPSAPVFPALAQPATNRPVKALAGRAAFTAPGEKCQFQQSAARTLQ